MKKNMTDILFIIGAIVICYGISRIYLPAAIILGGFFVLLASYSINKVLPGGRK